MREVLMALFAWTAFATSAAEPFEIKGIRLGVAETALQEQFKQSLQCSNNMSAGTRTCEINAHAAVAVDRLDLMAFAGHSAMVIWAEFAADELGDITVALRSEAFDDVLAAAREKYGPPSSVAAEVIQNRMGAKFTNRVVRWHRKGEVLSLTRYAGDTSTSTFSLRSEKFLGARASAAAERTKKNAKSL